MSQDTPTQCKREFHSRTYKGATAACIIALILPISVAHGAATLVVTNLLDSGPGTLREAISAANSLGGGCITFQISGTITLASQLPFIAANIDVLGPGTNQLVISGNNEYRIFTMNSGTSNTLANLTIANGSARAPSAPRTNASGIFNSGTLTVTNCVIRNCTNAVSYGAGICNLGTLEMASTTVLECRSLYMESLLGGGIYNGGTMRVDNCTISRCRAYHGGGIYNEGQAWIVGSVVAGCQCDSGLGNGNSIASYGQLALTSCTISNGGGGWSGIQAKSFAATNCTIANNGGKDGGGLCLLTGPNFLSGCTIRGNLADGHGGGIYNTDRLTMENCTVTMNSRPLLNAGGAGGIWNAGVLQLTCCTVASNTATAGGAIQNSGTVLALDCIFAGNSSNDFTGVLMSQGYNFIQNPRACTIIGNITGNLLWVDPKLGPLRDNGGPTWTHALLPGSPATDAGTSFGAPLIDQRGISRPQGQRADMGAYEAFCAKCGPLAITKLERKPDGCTVLAASGIPGDICLVLYSTDFAGWQPLDVATNVDGTFTFTDNTCASVSQRIYRLQKIGPPMQ